MGPCEPGAWRQAEYSFNMLFPNPETEEETSLAWVTLTGEILPSLDQGCDYEFHVWWINYGYWWTFALCQGSQEPNCVGRTMIFLAKTYLNQRANPPT